MRAVTQYSALLGMRCVDSNALCSACYHTTTLCGYQYTLLSLLVHHYAVWIPVNCSACYHTTTLLTPLPCCSPNSPPHPCTIITLLTPPHPHHCTTIMLLTSHPP